MVHASRRNLNGTNKGATIGGDDAGSVFGSAKKAPKKVEGMNDVLVKVYDTPEKLDAAVESTFGANPEFKELLPEIKEVNRDSFLIFHEGAVVPGQTCTDVGPDAMKNVIQEQKKEFAVLKEIKEQCDSPGKINVWVAKEHVNFEETMGRSGKDALRSATVMCKECFCNANRKLAFVRGMHDEVVGEVLSNPSALKELNARPCQSN